jgi:hypothetical protein
MCLIHGSLTELQRGVLKIMHGESCASMSRSLWVTVRHEHHAYGRGRQQREAGSLLTTIGRDLSLYSNAVF